MADVKISGLPSSTTPLAGTEVLPIVQSGATKQVSIANVTAGRDVSALSITTPTYKAANSAGGALQNASGVNQLQWGAGGGNNVSVDVAITINPANAAVAISPTGTGTVAISPAGALTVNPTAASTMNNVAIGGTTPLAGRFTTATANSFIPNSATIPTNGMYLPSANNLAFATDSVNRMQVSSVGVSVIGQANSILSVTSVYGAGASVIDLNASGATAQDTRIVGGAGSSSNLGFYTGGASLTERMRIDSSGIVTMSAYGAGAATFSASGVISSVSDETWKTKDGVPVNPDAMLQKLEPGYWFYNEEKSPIFGADRQLGFYAQNVHEAIGKEAAPTPEEGKPWGYYDRSVLAVAVMSLKNALSTIEELKQRIAILENK